MRTRKFSRQLLQLQTLVWFQRSLRMMIRSLWIGIGTYLLIWALNHLFGFFPNRVEQWLVVIFLTSIPLIRIPFLWPKQQSFVWRLDRLLGLNEQVSTAVQEIDENQPDSIRMQLFIDAQALIQNARRRIVRKGWALLPELVSLVLVCFLLAGIYWTSGLSMNANQISPQTTIEKLPALMIEPNLVEKSVSDLNNPEGQDDQNLDPTDPAAVKEPEEPDDQNTEGGADSGAGDQPGDRELGPVTDLDRILNEGEEFSLSDEMDQTDIPGILIPGTENLLGGETASGTTTPNLFATDEIVTSPLLPYTYPWTWQDVISAYFQPFE